MKKTLKVYLNAPITLSFASLCLLALLLDYLTNGSSTSALFSTYRSSLLNPLTYVRLVTHVLGHASFAHLVNNMLYILLLGPMLEEKYHDKLIVVIVVTALVTGIIHNLLDGDTALLGASGVVFAFILLAPITGKSNGIPITLILVAILWLGNEIINGVSSADSISQLTHIIGGMSGAFLGLFYKNN